MDPAVARSRLLLAERNVDRARRERSGDDADAALIFAEQALINAAEAILARDGFGANSHVVRFSYPGLPVIYQEERSLIDACAPRATARNTTLAVTSTQSSPIARLTLLPAH